MRGTLAVLATGWMSAAQPAQPQLTPLVADVMSAPYPVPVSDGFAHLLYEVRIANITDGRFTLKRIEVRDEHDKTLAQLDARTIGTRFCIGGRRGSESNVLEASQFGVAFLDVAVARAAALPRSLTHVIEGYSDKAAAAFTIRVAVTRVVTADPRALGAPLHGRGFVSADGCCDSIRHVRALLALDARFYLAQRFAIDWEKIDEAGRVFTGDPKAVGSYRIYNQPIFAVADGTVVAARNDLEDQVPGQLPQGLPLDQADGNFAVIDLGRGVYALYAHMRHGSVAVSAGNKVHRGEQIGNVGNTGNTQAPHLHFQLMGAPSALAANGLPYVFDRYLVTAIDAAGTADFDRAEATGTPLTLTPRDPPAQEQGTLPLDLSIVTWQN